MYLALQTTIFGSVAKIKKLKSRPSAHSNNLKNRSKLVVGLFFIVYAMNLNAQAIPVKGKIMSSEGYPLQDTEIRVNNGEKGTLSDNQGNYQIQLNPGKHTLSANLLNYETRYETIEITESDTLINIPVIILETREEELKEVLIQAKPKMRVSRENGNLAVRVSQTEFEDALNVWEGIKKTPLLDTKDDDGIQVFGQNALIKINGIETHLSKEELEGYLKSLSPKTVEKIEIQPNPGSEYGPEVKAVVNIVLKKGVNNYQIGLQTTNGVKSDYFNDSGLNYALNKEKVRLYTNYNFTYQPYRRDGAVAQQFDSEPIFEVETHGKTTPKNHRATVNVDFDLSPKDQIVLSNILNFSDSQNKETTSNEELERRLNLHSTGHQLQFSQVWKHSFNDTVTLKVGAYEVFQKSNNHSSAINNANTQQQQEIHTDIPIYIGFTDYEHKNKWGVSSAGLKYKSISVENRNQNFGTIDFSAPYQYNEKIFAAYVGHRFSFKNGANLQLGLRSETAHIDYHFDSPSNNESFTGTPRYTDLLFNAEYSWSTENQRFYNFAFRKTVDRPNYSYLNPFQRIENDLIFASGDTQLNRTRNYLLTFYTFKGSWTFSAGGMYMNDYITQFFDEKNGAINLTYRNFRDVYAVQAQAQYNHYFFNDLWHTKTSFTLTQIDLKDPHYEIGKITPNTWFSTYNTFKLTPRLNLDLEYFIALPYKQGVMEMKNSISALGLSLTQKIGDRFSMKLYARDLFKTQGYHIQTTVSNYYYRENTYMDSRTFGVALNYSFTGSSYKQHHIESSQDSAIDRLN